MIGESFSRPNPKFFSLKRPVEAWIAPPELRELRELVRYRAKLVNIRTGLKAQVKAVLAKHCLRAPVNDLWVGKRGPSFLDDVQLLGYQHHPAIKGSVAV